MGKNIENKRPVNNIRLSDVAGYEEEKKEIGKLVRLLNDYKRYEKLGVRIPKGLILQGPPGTGKTLLAKAIAGECNIPFFSFQQSDNPDEILNNLEKVFKEAYKFTPSIIYIDEIDKIVTNSRYSSDIARATVQYLLTKLDGIDSKSGTMVIASTNCYNEIPTSLLRSGRIDKKILVDYPNLDSRIKILKYYIKDYPLFTNLNIKNLAIKLERMSGADIKTPINNALIEYIDSKEFVEVDDFQKLINEMHFETIGKRWNSKKCLKKVLAHEVGHSLVGYVVDGKASAITGIKYGDVAGFTSEFEVDDDDDFIPIEESIDEINEIISDEEDNNYCKEQMLGLIRKAFGGLAAEKVYYGYYDTGASSDLNTVDNLFREMCESLFLRYNLREVDHFACSEHFKDRYVKERDKIFKKEIKAAVKIIKKNKYLGLYLIDKAIENDDSLSQKEINMHIDYYKQHKKELDKKYKKYNILTTKETN